MKPRLARFRVVGLLDHAHRAGIGTIVIDRATNIVTVRPLRRRKTYSMTLAEVAAWIVRQNILAEVREKRAKKAARRGR